MTKTDIGKRIGTRLRALRDAAHLTQPDLAERVGSHGIETETVSRYERGMRVPTLPMLSDLAAALGTDLDTLLAGVINAEPVDRVELKKIVALLEPLSDEHLRAVRAMITAHLEGVAATAKPATSTTRKQQG
jgi:transcriptional regulator with XRE-family HTH domain